MGLIRERHEEILRRLTRAIRSLAGNIHVEQVVPGDPEMRRPDLIMISPDRKHALVVDVTIPFEGSPDALQDAHEAKNSKYEPLKQWMTSEGGFELVEVHAFVISSLGSWDPGNEEVLSALGVRRRYAHLFRNLCSVSAIQGSRRIWAVLLRP